MLLSADANVPTAAAIDLRESIRRDGGTAATVAEMGEFGRGVGGNEKRKLYLKVLDETSLKQFDVLFLS